MLGIVSDCQNCKYIDSQSPRLHLINLHDIPHYESDISELTDMVFADTSHFPQNDLDLVHSYPDELAEYDIYAEYYPYIGLDLKEYNLDNMPICIYNLFINCLEQINIDSLSQQSSPLTIDI